MLKPMKYIHLIMAAVFITACKPWSAEQEEGAGGPVEMKITLSGNENGEIPYPVKVFCMESGKDNVLEKEFGADEIPVMLLPEGEFSVNVMCGISRQDYSVSEDIDGIPVVEMKSGNVSSSPLMAAHARAVTDKPLEISLTPEYAVSSVRFSLTNIPEGAERITAEISPVGGAYRVKDGVCKPEAAAVITFTEDGGTWTSGQRYVFPYDSSITRINIDLDYGDRVKSFGYSMMKGLEKGKPYVFTGSFGKDEETGEDVLRMEGDFGIGKWDMEEEINLDMGEGTGNAGNDDNDTGGTGNDNGDMETFIVDEIPERFDVFGPMFVWKSEKTSENEAKVTVISYDQWPEVLACDALPTLEAYTLDGIGGWRMFTEEEARKFFKDFDGGNSEINDILYANGHNIFYENSADGKTARYLCGNARKTFNLYGKLLIRSPGEKTKYYLRPVKTMIFKIKK